MNREDVNELYTIRTIDGTLVLEKEDVDEFLKPKDDWSYKSDMIVNPFIQIKGGILTISGTRISHSKVRNLDGFTWIPKPIREMKDNWKELIFHTEENIIDKNFVSWVGPFWPFMKRKVEKHIKHLEPGWYVKKTGKFETYTTSNYRLIGYVPTEQKGLVTG